MIVSTAFRDDEGTGIVPGGAVHVAIWALRRTVSNGYLISRSMAERAKEATLQLLGFRTGSMLSLFFSTSGVECVIMAGIVDVNKVIGMRCEGMM